MTNEDKKRKEFFEKELLWKYPIMFLALIVCVKILQYLDNIRPNFDLLVGIFALFMLLAFAGMTILGIIWMWFSVKPFLINLLQIHNRPRK